MVTPVVEPSPLIKAVAAVVGVKAAGAHVVCPPFTPAKDGIVPDEAVSSVLLPLISITATKGEVPVQVMV